jgi:replicative DNA helicase
VKQQQILFSPLVGKSLTTIGEKITDRVDATPTPFPAWNDVCGEEGGRIGVANSWMIVLGGADGSGKSYLAVNLAAHGVLQGKKVGFINFEMTKVGLTQRYLAILSGYPKYQLEHGKYFKMEAWLRAQRVADEVHEETGGMLITNDSGVFDLDDIVDAYAMLADQGCDAILLDYAQLVQVKGTGGIFQRSEEVANTLRVLTHEHRVASYVLSQFNREGKKLGDTQPTRHYLQGGSAWENNANQILLIDHTLRIRDAEGKFIHTRLLVDKNRHGQDQVEIPVTWNLKNMRWEEGVPEAYTEGGVALEEDEPAQEYTEETGGLF